MRNRVTILIGITSDIGTALAIRYAKENHTIIGTYRSRSQIEKLTAIPNCYLFHCDINNKNNISRFVQEFIKLDLRWDTFISCPCNPLPLKSFFKCDFDEWSDSIHINAIEQLRILHRLYPLRSINQQVPNVVFFAGGGINNAVIKFSAYTISKIMLIKMCEFLDAENEDLNIFIIGPGWTMTKIHQLILKNVDQRDKRYYKTKNFIESKRGTNIDDIYNYIKWLCGQGKEIAGGRNFSVVYDKWQGKSGQELSDKLKKNPDMYKLRRNE